MIKMNGFDDYFYNPDTWEVHSKSGVLKPQRNGNKAYFWLFRNSERIKVLHWEILLSNWEKIEIFLKERKQFQNH